ncbi:hypothetical protein DNI29_16150 [Hymenobacter sediminis]|uniref:hypothetical protein n=1 Tax=Hymenobacter sediminis TaxID=2218621 RepID=UPI000DA6954B|nr:hypothetical protein [Hymenobacter sediminis]RPD45689.1 hypothetical protein DNI29_16150 [Hymenobacter sediminis]
MLTFPAPDYLSLTYRNDLNFLVVRWLRPVTGDETRAGYALILATAKQCDCPYWLLDGRRRQPADAETTRWGLTEFFPSLSATMGRRVFLSQLLSPMYQQLTEAMPAFSIAETDSARTYYMRRFNDENHAVQWLQQQQRASATP